MDLPKGKAAYKKKDGIISLSSDKTLLVWTPVAGGAGVSLSTASISNLQQTPDSATKVMLKVFEKPPGHDGDPNTYLFHFNSPNDARAEANAIKNILSALISMIRSHDSDVPRPSAAGSVTATTHTRTAVASTESQGNGGGGYTFSGGASTAMAFANTAVSRPENARWFDDNQLKTDIELQQSLMKKNKAVHQTYMDAQQSKPDSISDAAFNAQFWSTRTAMLRAHAIDINQKKGAYNVLSTIKPRTVDGELKLSISVEQVQMIFSQHPLVKRIYNEHVPRISEDQFWSRFFLSRLSKKLRGERVLDNERADPLFDRYDETDDIISSSLILTSHVPHIIDLEANEEDQGGSKGGNRQDVEMRPRSNIPIVRTLNSLSEKIMATVAPADKDPTTSAKADLDTQRELTLRDLNGDAPVNRITLNVREQSRFFNQSAASSRDNETFEYQITSEVLFDIQADIDTLEDNGVGGINLHAGLGIEESSDSENDGQQGHVGSRAARQAAQKQIWAAVSQRRSELYGHSSDEQTPMGLPVGIAQKAYITNATTTEFLKQFWNSFLSGDPGRAQELVYHVESLKKSVARIEAIAEEAEQARNKVVDELKEEIRVRFSRNGRRVRWRPEMIGGGSKAIHVLLGPTINSLQTAQRLYEEALAAEGHGLNTEA